METLRFQEITGQKNRSWRDQGSLEEEHWGNLI